MTSPSIRRTSRLMAILLFAAVAPALTPAILPAQGVPVLVDRELYFGNPEISGAQISPDGRYISFLKPYKDSRNVWVKGVNEPYSAARLVTNDIKRPVTSYFWSVSYTHLTLPTICSV